MGAAGQPAASPLTPGAAADTPEGVPSDTKFGAHPTPRGKADA